MKILVTGGAGFIGSNLVDRLLKDGHFVVVVDNLSGGNISFIQKHIASKKVKFIQLDLRETKKLTQALKGLKIGLVYHLAANSDISKGIEDPTIDFENSTVATFSLLQALRDNQIKKIVYTSGSGVYGDRGKNYSQETFGPLQPVSMYGATKLSAEGLISAFVHFYDMQAWILRPANIIGPRLTHGVVFDFVKRLKKNSGQLQILGDGQQSKAYLHVADVVNALILVKKGREKVNFYNLSSNSFITVNRIANLIIKKMRLKNVKLSHTPGRIGWKGDVAIVRLNNAKIKKIGWQSHFTSRQAIEATIDALLPDPRLEP